MNLILIGAESEGQRFIDMAAEQNHSITLIEVDEEKAREVLKNHNIRVLRGHIADDNILQEASIDQADALVAMTYDDAQNMMAMYLAKEHNVATRISLVNQASHVEMFEKLGVQVVSDPASIIARQLYDHLK